MYYHIKHHNNYILDNYEFPYEMKKKFIDIISQKNKLSEADEKEYLEMDLRTLLNKFDCSIEATHEPISQTII